VAFRHYPDNLTPHWLRRTFASVLYALGESPPVVMAEMGDTSPALALRVYAQVMCAVITSASPSEPHRGG
jgi:integrase